MSCPAVGAARAGLSPAGHPAVDQASIPFPAGLRADAETLHDPWPESLQQNVGALREVQHQRHAGRLFQVDTDGPLAAFEQVPRRAFGDGLGHCRRAFDPQHVGPEVGEHHRRERAGPDAG